MKIETLKNVNVLCFVIFSHLCVMQNGGHNSATITSEDLEQRYLNDNKAVVEFTAGSQTYILSFQGELLDAI